MHDPFGVFDLVLRLERAEVGAQECATQGTRGWAVVVA
jgi:hypothetical protein